MMVTAYVTAAAAAPSVDDDGAELGVNEDSQVAVGDAVEAALDDDQEGEENHYRRHHHRHHHHHRRPYYYGGLRFRRSIDEGTADAALVDTPSQDDLEAEASYHHHGHRRHHHHHRHYDYRRQGYYGRQRY